MNNVLKLDTPNNLRRICAAITILMTKRTETCIAMGNDTLVKGGEVPRNLF